LQKHLEYGVEEKALIALLSKCELKGIEEPKIYSLSIKPEQRNAHNLRKTDEEVKEKEECLREDPIQLDLHDEPDETLVDQPDEFQEMSA
jgi:hypothetical protein